MELKPEDCGKLVIGPRGHATIDGVSGPGHPIRLTDEAIEKIISYVKAGNYLQVAFAAAGFNRGSWPDWRLRGLKVREQYPDLDLDTWLDECPDLIPPNVTPANWQAFKLMTRMEQAEAEAEAYAVLTVRKHMPDQWAAAMSYLERRFPERWRKRQTIENIDGGTVVDGIDEDALIQDPKALELLHDALEGIIQGKEAPELNPGASLD